MYPFKNSTEENKLKSQLIQKEQKQKIKKRNRGKIGQAESRK